VIKYCLLDWLIGSVEAAILDQGFEKNNNNRFNRENLMLFSNTLPSTQN
jgi:hypothetical protein